MKNQLVGKIFREIAQILRLKGENVFRIRAYERAAQVIENMSDDIGVLTREDRLTGIPGIGKDLADKIREIVSTGSSAYHGALNSSLPAGMLEMLSIPSVGPKTAKLLSENLKIASIPELQKAIDSDRLKGIPGIKDKTIENISKGIALVINGMERMSLLDAEVLAREFTVPLEKMPCVEKLICAGSLRRRRESVRDIDILAVSKDPVAVMDAFTALPLSARVQSKGDTKSSVITPNGIQVDCRVVESRSFGAAAVYFTGSKDFNVKIRQLAQKTSHKINEYGVFHADKNGTEKYICGKTEEEIFNFLNMQYIPPELRENLGEIEAALGGSLPRLIEESDIRGDVHVHSTWSDGAGTIAEMALAAKAKGYSYIALTDHSQSLKVAHGMSVADLVKKRREIDKLNEKFKPFRILFGAEVDINSDGSMDYPDNVLSEFEVVIAAVHTGMQQPGKVITDRVLRACSHPGVHIIAHPTGRSRGSRDAYDLDLEAVFKRAKETNTAFEINSFPDRMDLNDINCRRAKDAGVKICVNTDSHSTSHLEYIRFGLAMARRGWLSPGDVLNTRSVEGFLKAIKK